MTVGTLPGRPLADDLSGPDRWWGIHVALVVDNQDPLNHGRVKVRLPWLPDQEGLATWARVSTLMAGPNRGSWFVPDPDDEVVVAFEGGCVSRPVVLGSVWNGDDAPPEQMEAGNPRRTFRTGSGVRITLDDTEGAISLVLETPGGQRIELADSGPSITAEDASGNSVTLDPSGVSVVSSSQVAVQASTVQVDASMVTVNAGMSKFSGVVQCDTVISNTVVSSAYTPGAGNIW